MTDNKESTGTVREDITKGQYLSDGSSYISDEGNNIVYISGTTYCHRTAEELRADVYLQRLENGTWVTVTYQHYSAYNTYYAHNVCDILVKPGYYYRTVTNLSLIHISPDICISCSSMIVGKIRQQADFVLDDEHISRVHARIEKNGDDVYVIDLNSTNGTFINGERLQANERRRLQPLDEVAFASIIYEYETEQQ